MKKNLIILLLSFSFLYVNSQVSTSTIRGTVFDVQSKQSLVGATVVILDANPQMVTTTDAKGEFKFENAPIGRQTIIVEFMGYMPVQLTNLMVVKGKETVLEIEMQESAIDIGNVVISTQVNKATTQNDMATVSSRSFSIEETERYAGSLGDPSRMAANFAGVMSVNDQRNDIIIRGNSPLGLLWRLDGIDIPNPNHFGAMGTTGGPVSMLNNNVLTNSDFFTGAFPAEYGNAVGGVFDLQMRSGNNQKYEFLGQVGFGGFEAGIEGPISRQNGSSFLINYRYSTLAVMSALGFDVGTGAAVPHYQDLNFKINIPRGKFGKLSVFGIGGINHIQMNDSEGDSASYGFGGTDLLYSNQMATVGLNYTYFFNNKSRITIKLAESYISQQTQLDSLYHNGQFNPYRFYTSDGETFTTVFAPEFYSKINAKNSFKIGLNLKYNQINYLDSVFIFEENKYIRQYDMSESYIHSQTFVEYQHRFSDKVILNLGVFAHYLDINNSYNAEPRFGFKWQFTNKQSIDFGAGMHSQLQIPLLYYVSFEDSTNNLVQTNKDLGFNKSIHAVIGHNFLLNTGFRIKTELYYQYLYNIPISEENQQFSVLNIGDDFYIPAYSGMINDGTGRNYGVELTIEKFLSEGFYFLITTSIFESKYTAFDGIERNTKYNGNYVFNGLGGYEFKLGDYSILAFDIKGMYAGGKRYIPIDEELSETTGRTQYFFENSYAEQYDPYFRINARITFKTNAKKANMSQEWGLDLQNLTNHQNIFQQDWDTNTNSVRTYYQQGFMPMMTYRILF
ncbi:MAG: TonB-dependent receptor [Bacteroidales bacterium]|nr:TonB-dependent receptor [Bacteroidales bacterium]